MQARKFAEWASRSAAIASLALAAAAAAPSDSVAASRILGGVPITGGSMRAQMVRLTAYGQTLCSGVFLNSQWVLTAAHCFDQAPADVTAVYQSGATRVSQVHRHPSYDRATGVGDVALLKLIEPANGAVSAAPAATNPAGGDRVWVAGFGVVENGSSGAAYLGFQTTRGGCPAGTAGAEAGLRWCAGLADDSATCFGDSGGPAFDVNGAIAGITSMTATGCPRGGVTIYTAVAAYLDWIYGTAVDTSERSGWYRQVGLDLEGWSVQFTGARAFVGWLGYDATGAATWTVASLTRSESGLFEGSPIACRVDRTVRTCSPAVGNVSLAVTAIGLRLRSTAEAGARTLVPYQP